MDICFCLNNLGALGLGAGLTSLLHHTHHSSSFTLNFLCSSVDEKIKTAIVDLLNESNFTGKYRFIDFNAKKEFGKYRPLQNDWTTYGKLLIPELIQADTVLYLDTDLIIETEISEIFTTAFEKFEIGAVPSTSIQYSLEHNFFCSILNINPALKTFNAGVLLINSKAWFENNVKLKLLKIADKYPHELLSADQALLNAFFAGNFFNLNDKYNIHWYPRQKPAVADNAIFHFVGSPKPWDYFGRYIHTGYDKWNHSTSEHWNKNVLHLNKMEQIARCWSIRKSYFKTVLKK